MRDAAISFPMLGNLTINPKAYFTIFGVTVYWYGVLLALAVLCAMWWIAAHAKYFGIEKDTIYDEAIWCIILGVLGCRIYYVIFQWDYYSQHLGEIIKIWDGGIGMYGGLIACFLFLLVWTKAKKIPLGALLDADASGLLLGHSIGRWGNFINREAFGSETGIFCRMGLTEPGQETVYVHPTFLYESLWTLLGFIVLNVWAKKGKRKYDGQLFILYILWYGAGRAMIEGLRTDSLYLIPGVIRVSQLVGILSVISMAIVLLVQSRREHPPEKLYVNRIKAEAESTDYTPDVQDSAGTNTASSNDTDIEPETVDSSDSIEKNNMNVERTE